MPGPIGLVTRPAVRSALRAWPGFAVRWTGRLLALAAPAGFG